MWARHAEVAIALWLAMSPLIMRHGEARWLWIHDLLIAVVIATLALLSYWRPTAQAHLFLLIVAAWLIGLGWWQAHAAIGGATAATQNWIVVGLLLMIFAIVPNYASAPPGQRN